MRFCLPGLVLLAATACSKPEAPKLTPDRASVTAVSAAGIDLRVELSAFNPNRVDLSAQSISVKVAIDGRPAGTAIIDHPISLPAGQTTKLDAPVTVKWAEAASLVALAAQGRDMPFTLDGAVGLGGDLLHVDVPFQMAGTLTRDAVVRAGLRSIPQLPLLPPPPP